MRTQLVDHNSATPPTLFANTAEEDNPLMPLFDAVLSMDRSLDLIQVLRKAAERSGNNFLFEIPGILFGLPNHRVAVIEITNEESAKTEHMFVLCGQQEGIVSSLSVEEIPEAAQRFFYSYVSVLSCLSKIPTVKEVH